MKSLLLLSAVLFSANGFCLTNTEVKGILQSAYDSLEGKNEVRVTKVSAIIDYRSVFVGMGQAYDSLNNNSDFEFKKVTLEASVDDFDYNGNIEVKQVKTTCVALVSVTKTGKKSVDVRECNKKAFERADVWDMSGYFQIAASTSSGKWIRDNDSGFEAAYDDVK